MLSWIVSSVAIQTFGGFPRSLSGTVTRLTCREGQYVSRTIVLLVAGRSERVADLGEGLFKMHRQGETGSAQLMRQALDTLDQPVVQGDTFVAGNGYKLRNRLNRQNEPPLGRNLDPHGDTVRTGRCVIVVGRRTFGTRE